jgi:hypothetical protein
MFTYVFRTFSVFVLAFVFVFVFSQALPKTTVAQTNYVRIPHEDHLMTTCLGAFAFQAKLMKVVARGCARAKRMQGA